MIALALTCLCAVQAPPWLREEWEAAHALPAGIERERAICELSYRARDFWTAIAAARAGLLLEPRDLRLLQLQCGSALWLADAANATAALERWQSALALDSTLPSESRAWWSDRIREQSTLVQELVDAAEVRARCSARAYWVSAAWGIAIAAALAWIAAATTVGGRGRGRT